ncbi:MAG: hypothetical protein Q7S57_06315 [bacterium]|nr:hypothetical protein [bacterium]
MATDGCLISDGRHLNLTSKDTEQLLLFKKILKLKVKISYKSRGGEPRKMYGQLQFGDVELYRWFISIGITPRKSKTIGAINVPDRFFFDHLRGEFDGDGSSCAYWDTRWRSSVSLYMNFCSASRPHLEWIQKKVLFLLEIVGCIKKARSIYVLQYSKTKARPLFNALYDNQTDLFLKRKKDKMDRQWTALSNAKNGIIPTFSDKNHAIKIS